MNKKKIPKECYKCEVNILFKTIKFKGIDETIKELLENKKSISRFGDGEFKIIFGKNITFQEYDKTLKNKLLKVLNSKLPNLLIGINKLYKSKNKIINKFHEKYKFQIAKIINKNKIYYDSGITRFNTRIKNKKIIKKYITKFKKIWDNRNILIIEGEKTRSGIGNNLFHNSKNIKRIICPAENSFKIYDKLIAFIKSIKLDKETLILTSLGPTATILSYDIYELGNQVIDLGHFDLQYEFFLRNTKKIIKIPYKYVAEVEGGQYNISPITDSEYFDQIIRKIY